MRYVCACMCTRTQAPTHPQHTLLAQVKQGKLKAAEAQDRMRRAIVGHVKAYWHILHRHGRGPNTVHVRVDVMCTRQLHEYIVCA